MTTCHYLDSYQIDLLGGPHALSFDTVVCGNRWLLHSFQPIPVQVYFPVERPATSDDLIGDRIRPLAPKLEALLDLLVYCMKDEWGGQTREACTERMLAAARQFGGCTESL
jgi:hypothetical protein